MTPQAGVAPPPFPPSSPPWRRHKLSASTERDDWIDLKHELFSMQERISKLCPQYDLFELYLRTRDRSLIAKSHIEGICPRALPLKRASSQQVETLGEEFSEWLSMACFLAKGSKKVPRAFKLALTQVRGDWDYWGIRLMEHTLLHLQTGLQGFGSAFWRQKGREILISLLLPFLKVPRNTHGSVHFSQIRRFVMHVEWCFKDNFPEVMPQIIEAFKQLEDAKCLHA